jgi:hypothetical protein
MKTSITLSPSNVPAPSPIPTLAIIFLLLAHFSAPDWSYWLLGLLAFLSIWGWLLTRKHALVIDLFEESKSTLGMKK